MTEYERTPGLDPAAMREAEDLWNTRAKPPGSLGDIERIGVQLAGIAGFAPPPVPRRPAIVVFGGDHGVTQARVSQWPSEVTRLMASSMATGGAAISAFARIVGASLTVVDVGIAGPPVGHGVVDRRVRAGTANLVEGPAMTVDEALQAVQVGRAVTAELIDAGADLIVGGDMGIGNTTPSSILIALTLIGPPSGITPERPGALTASAVASAVTGPGAGLSDDARAHKRLIVERAVEQATELPDPWARLAAVGGLEIAALAGCYIEAALRRIPYVVDGVIALAALCVADSITPGIPRTALAGHRSTEPAASLALERFDLRPLLDLNLRLGEGTGAALAIPLVQAAAEALNAMDALPA